MTKANRSLRTDDMKYEPLAEENLTLSAENICVSDTTVRPRKDMYLFDSDAVNEAVLNALVHNDSYFRLDHLVELFREVNEDTDLKLKHGSTSLWKIYIRLFSLMSSTIP